MNGQVRQCLKTVVAECDGDAKNSLDCREADGTVALHNEHVKKMKDDFLYHLALGTGSHDIFRMFHDVKFVCMGGSVKRMENFAHYIMGKIGHHLPTGVQLLDIAQKANRYCMYKVGPVLSVSHGIGIASLSVLLHELIKLMYHAKAKDPVFLRIGTSGGVGLEPGTVVVTNGAVDGMLNTHHELLVLGKKVQHPSVFDGDLVDELVGCADPENDDYETVRGITVSTNDFYEEQGRLDGAFCDYTEDEKMTYLYKLKTAGVANFEMEALAFGAMCHRAGIKGGVVCTTLVNRLHGDQVTTPKSILGDWEVRPQELVAKFIKGRLAM